MIHAIAADTRRLRIFEATPGKAPVEVPALRKAAADLSMLALKYRTTTARYAR
jgi:hypothetical protein